MVPTAATALASSVRADAAAVEGAVEAAPAVVVACHVAAAADADRVVAMCAWVGPARHAAARAAVAVDVPSAAA